MFEREWKSGREKEIQREKERQRGMQVEIEGEREEKQGGMQVVGLHKKNQV